MTSAAQPTRAQQDAHAQRLLQEAADWLVDKWTADAWASIDALMASLDPSPKESDR